MVKSGFQILVKRFEFLNPAKLASAILSVPVFSTSDERVWVFIEITKSKHPFRI